MKREQTLAQYLKSKRLAANLSQAEVGRKFGFSTAQFVSNWERGKSTPPISVMRKLVVLYKMPLEEAYEHLLSDVIARETRKIKKAFGRN